MLGSTRAPFQVSRRKADILSLKVKNFLSLKVAAFLGHRPESQEAHEAWSAKISLVILSLEARLSKVSSVVLFGVSYAHAGGLCYAVPSLYPGRSAQPEGG